MFRAFVLTLALLCVPHVAAAQQADLGRFRIGMSVAQVRAASPELSWREQLFGVDLVVLSADESVRIGQLGFQPQLQFRDGRLVNIQFEACGPIANRDQCDRVLVATVTALEPIIGALNSSRSPGEFGPIANTQTTPGGSEIRFYSPSESVHAGNATQRGAFFIQVSAVAAPVPRELSCRVGVEMMPSLADFDPPPPPTAAELAAAEETEPDWAVEAGPDVTSLTMPLDGLLYEGRVRVRLSCLVISEQRINCAVQGEEPLAMHFGDAALAASRFYRIQPVIDGHATLGRRVEFTVRYDLSLHAPR